MKKNKSNKKIKGFSLTFKISLTITLLITMLMVGMGAMTYRVNHQLLVQQETSRGVSMGKLAVEIVAPQLETGDKNALATALGVLKADPSVLQTYVTDPQGRVTAHEQPESIGNTMQSRALENARAYGELQRQQTVTEGGTSVMLFVVPLKNSGGSVKGYLHYMTDFTHAEAFLVDTVIQWIGVFLIAVLVSLILVRLVIIRAVGKPLKQLQIVTEKATMGDFSGRLDPRTKDELGQLAEGFNLMIQQLGILYKSVNQTVREMDFASQQIVSKSEALSVSGDAWQEEKKDEWLKEIVSNGKRLVRVTDKLKTFLSQYQIEE